MNVVTYDEGSGISFQNISPQKPDILGFKGDMFLMVKGNIGYTMTVSLTPEDLTAIYEHRRGYATDKASLLGELEEGRKESHRLKNQVQALKLELALITKK